MKSYVTVAYPSPKVMSRFRLIEDSVNETIENILDEVCEDIAISFSLDVQSVKDIATRRFLSLTERKRDISNFSFVAEKKERNVLYIRDIPSSLYENFYSRVQEPKESCKEVSLSAIDFHGKGKGFNILTVKSSSRAKNPTQTDIVIDERSDIYSNKKFICYPELRMEELRIFYNISAAHPIVIVGGSKWLRESIMNRISCLTYSPSDDIGYGYFYFKHSQISGSTLVIDDILRKQLGVKVSFHNRECFDNFRCQVLLRDRNRPFVSDITNVRFDLIFHFVVVESRSGYCFVHFPIGNTPENVDDYTVVSQAKNFVDKILEEMNETVRVDSDNEEIFHISTKEAADILQQKIAGELLFETKILHLNEWLLLKERSKLCDLLLKYSTEPESFEFDEQEMCYFSKGQEKSEKSVTDDE